MVRGGMTARSDVFESVIKLDVSIVVGQRPNIDRNLMKNKLFIISVLLGKLMIQSREMRWIIS
jgi:hypothetical protein